MSTKTMIRIITLSMGLLAAVPVMGFAQGQPTTPSASSSFDKRWTAYLGCWRLQQESVFSTDVTVSDVMMVCAAPASTGSGVTLTTYALDESEGWAIDLEHLERQKWVGEIAKINRRLNEPES